MTDPSNAAPPPRLPFWTPTSMFGFLMFVVACSLGGWALHTHQFTGTTFWLAIVLAGSGMAFVNLDTTRAVVQVVRDVTPGVLRGRTSIVDAPAGTDTVVTRPGEPPTVVPAVGKPEEARTATAPADAVAAVAMRHGAPLGDHWADLSPVDLDALAVLVEHHTPAPHRPAPDVPTPGVPPAPHADEHHTPGAGV